MKEKKKDIIFLRWLPLLLVNAYVIFPIYWSVITSLKSEADIVSTPIHYIPKSPSLSNFINAWLHAGFSQYFANSLKISIVSVLIIVIMSIMVGYALTRYKFKGKKAFMGFLLASQFIPAAVLLVPLFNIFQRVGLVGTRTAIVLVNITFHIPFNAILMKGFIEGIPFELEEAAMVDGCSRFRGVIKIVLPMLVPGIITVSAFAFIACWNEFLFSLMFLNDPAKYTVPIGLKMMQGEFSVQYGAMAAGAIIAMSIPVCLFAYLQKYLVTGLSTGGVKG
ncbi:carbohydrate ABC transporter permease [Lacrimispora sp.]|uniref:carbohydrate ABC transporter permease n=1 Tax=Lacrimispora sp. TaxID=2719234 RepID=UPI00289942FD|nr:carbohydrate ABC transporter permease [Lacrimispora sp.]